MKKSGLWRCSLSQVLEILFPVCLHLFILQFTAILLGEQMDAAALSTLAALFTFPAVWYLYRREEKAGKKCSLSTLWIPFALGMAGNLLFSGILDALAVKEVFSDRSQEALFSSAFFVQLFGLGIWVPFVEELIFRGLVYGKIKKYFGVGAGVIFSALLFALYHGNMVQFLYACPMGILLALVYEKWGTLAAPVLFHVGANLYGVLLGQLR